MKDFIRYLVDRNEEIRPSFDEFKEFREYYERHHSEGDQRPPRQRVGGVGGVMRKEARRRLEDQDDNFDDHLYRWTMTLQRKHELELAEMRGQIVRPPALDVARRARPRYMYGWARTSHLHAS